jgi:hypothetical protein
VGRRVLVVEGADDRHVLLALLAAHAVPEVFRIDVAHGAEHLLDTLPTRLKESDLERLAVILDADEAVERRWEQLRRILLRAGGSSVPEAPSVGGTVLELDGGLTVGVWLMPDNRLPGMLEHFVLFLTPRDDVLLPLVEQFLDTVPEHPRRFRPHHRAKALIHAWLALQNEPGKPMGLAITSRHLDAGQEVAGPLVDWLRRVLVD